MNCASDLVVIFWTDEVICGILVYLLVLFYNWRKRTKNDRVALQNAGIRLRLKSIMSAKMSLSCKSDQSQKLLAWMCCEELELVHKN